MRLYELSDAINKVAEMMEDGFEGLEDTLESIEATFQQKVESIVKLKHSKDLQAKMIGEEIERLSAMKKKLTDESKWLGDYVEAEMKRTNTQEVKSNLFKIRLKATPPRVEGTDIFSLPDVYVRRKTIEEPDKIKIKEALQKGEIIPGWELKSDLKLSVR